MRNSCDESEQTQNGVYFKAHLKSYSVVVDAVKKDYFSVSIASAQNKTAMLLRTAWHILQLDVSSGSLNSRRVAVSSFHCSLQTKSIGVVLTWTPVFGQVIGGKLGNGSYGLFSSCKILGI